MQSSIALSSNLLGWDLLIKLYSTNPPSSSLGISISPLSVSIALAMLAGGANSSNRQLLYAKLGIDDTAQAVKVFSSLHSEALSIANAVFCDSSFQISPQYTDHVGAFNAIVDASSESLATNVDVINGWISDHTREMIPEMLSKAMLARSHMVLINALAFKGSWENKFDPKYTIKDHQFHMADNRACLVEMMFMNDQNIQLHDGAGYTAVRLPFTATSPDMSLIAYLPDDDTGSVAALLPKLRLGVSESFIPTKLSRFGIPKFDIKTDVELLGLLEASGFPLRNDFPEIGPGKNEVGQILHSTAVKLDEEGAEAAAATVIFMRRGRPKYVRSLVFDRSFVFTIVVNAMNLVVFAGVISGI